MRKGEHDALHGAGGELIQVDGQTGRRLQSAMTGSKRSRTLALLAGLSISRHPTRVTIIRRHFVDCMARLLEYDQRTGDGINRVPSHNKGENMQRFLIILGSVALAMAFALAWTSTMAEDDDHLPIVDWPCESRFVLPQSVASNEQGVIAQVDWPGESGFAGLTGHTPAGSAAPIAVAAVVDANKLIYREVVTEFFVNGNAWPLFTHYPAVIAEVRLDEWTGWQYSFADLQPSLDFQIAEGDRVLSCWTFQGIHHGEFMGIAPTGKPVIFQVLYAARMVDGVVVEEIGQLELRSLLEQLELELAPRQS